MIITMIFDLDILPDGNAPVEPNLPVKKPTDCLAASKLVTTLAPSSIKAGVTGGMCLPDAGIKLKEILEQKRVGRASSYTTERACVVLEAVSNGMTMEKAAEAAGVTRSTVWTWMQVYPEFSDEIGRAREMQGQAMADDAVKMVDNTELISHDPKHTAMVLRKSEIQSRVRIRMAESYAPKTYGQKAGVQVNVAVAVSPLDLSRYE